jgi:hypothetical protein
LARDHRDPGALIHQRLDQPEAKSAASAGDDNILIPEAHPSAPLLCCSYDVRGPAKESAHDAGGTHTHGHAPPSLIHRTISHADFGIQKKLNKN